MLADTARAALELAAARTAERLHLVFFGGEPLLRWELLQSCTERAAQRCRELGLELRATVTTNGTLLDRAKATWLRDHDFVVGISCDGVAAAHDANRLDAEGAGTHERVVGALRVALAEGLRTRVVLVVDPSNVELLDASVEALAQLGADELVLSPNWSAPWDAPWDDGDGDGLDHMRRSYRRVAERYLRSYRERRPLRISFLDSKIASHVRGGCLAEDRCDLGRRRLVVAPSGNLYPCDRLVGADRDRRFVIGHVSTGPDPGRVAAMVKAAGALPDACRACELADRCQNRCACANVARSDRLELPSDLLCFHERVAIELSDEVAATLYAERNPAFMRRFYGT
jgi:uncharacterized protein